MISDACVVQRAKRLILISLGSVLFSFAANAGEIDLAEAGCPPLPPAGLFMTAHLVLHGDGTASNCVVSSEFSQFCDRYHSEEDGFLCVAVTRNPRPDITLSETTNNKMNDRLIVDGEEIPESYGKRVLRRDLGTGPSGATYDVIAEQTVGCVLHALIVNVTAEPDGEPKFNSMRVTYED